MLEGLLGRARYVGFSFDDTPGYAKLKQVIEQLDEEGGGKLNRAFYLSTAPEYFPVIVQALKDSDLNYDPDVDVRCIIEKPFGTDLESARSCSASSSTSSASRRSTASITTWARRPSRT